MVELYAITGGPCAGKTSVVEGLQSRGYSIIPEVATRVILELQERSIGYNPARDRYAFQDVVASRQLHEERGVVTAAGNGDAIFTDRSLFDGIGYCEVDGIGLPESRIPLPPSLRNLNPARYKRVFFLETLPPKCYTQTSVRQEDPEYAGRITSGIRAVYVRLGVNLVDVPFFDTNGDKGSGIEQRVNFILERL